MGRTPRAHIVNSKAFQLSALIFEMKITEVLGLLALLSVVSIGCAETNPGFSDRVHGASLLQDIEMDNAFEAQPETEVEVAMQFKKVKKIKKTKKKPVKSSCHCLAINKDGSVAKLCPRCVAKNCKTTDAKVHCAPPTKEPTAAPTMVPTAMPTSAPTAA